MRELDEILTSYLERQYPEASERCKSAFRALLELPDPVVARYLLQAGQPENEAIADVVRVLQRQHSA